MSIRRIVLAAALACGGPAAAAAAQTPQAGEADSAWVNLVTIMRLRDEFADRPQEEPRFHPHPTRPWAEFDRRVELPEPFRSATFTADSWVLLDVDARGRAAGCQPFRAGVHPELDAFACTLLMRRGWFDGTLHQPVPRPRGSVAGRWVMGLAWEGLTAAEHRERLRTGRTAAAPLPPVPPGEVVPPSLGPRRLIRGSFAPDSADYRGIADRRISEGRLEADLAVNEEGVPTGCRVTRSTGNPAIDERTCALLVERARFTRRIGASGRPVADTHAVSADVGRILSSGAPFAQPIQVGQTVRGRLESGDRLATERFYDDYAFTAASAMSLRVTMRSTDFGPFVFVISGDPPHTLGKGTNDRGGGDDARVTVEVPAGTRVRIRASSWAKGMQGAYTLEVTAN
jgi:hypothetical protein